MPIPPAPSLHAITTFLFDVDGVLTDGFVLALPDGNMVRRLHSKDGYALQLAVRLGYRIGIISGGYSPGVEQRFQNLGLQDVHFGVPYKLPVYEALKAKHGLQDEEILYLADDIPDVEILQRVGIPAAPADAAEDVLKLVPWVTTKPGGQGCVREVIETVLKAQSRWDCPEALRW